jgi:hypothetical protein
MSISAGLTPVHADRLQSPLARAILPDSTPLGRFSALCSFSRGLEPPASGAEEAKHHYRINF